jgi:HSP20 family protein
MGATALEKIEVKKGEKALRPRWDPMDIFEDMRGDLARFWTEPWPFMFHRAFRRPTKGVARWYPHVDMFEKGDDIVVKADLPGLKREDIQLSFEEGDLVIQGQTKTESEVKEEDYYYSERTAGSFYRRLALPADVKVEKIEANFKEGVLEIRIPKPAQKKPQAQSIAVH